MREKVIQFLDNPTTGAARAVTIALLALIYLTVAQVVIELRYPAFAGEHAAVLQILQYVILAVFTLELAVRLFCDARRWQYVKSFYGLVDIFAVAPGLVGFVLPIPSDSSWIRVFRVFRFGRALKFLRSGSTIGGVTGRLAPFLAMALGFKGLLVAVEVLPWWPKISNLSIVIGVAGFAVAILLGTKMRVISGRLYAVEDTVCRVIGCLRDMQSNKTVREKIENWAREFEATLSKPTEEAVAKMKALTDDLENDLEAAGIGGPVTTTFHRDVEYMLHRALARTPQEYEKFLQYVTIVYAAVVIVAVPGLTGFFASVLFIYVLGGMYLLIDDMDNPLDFGDDSLVSVDIRPLKAFNQKETG